MLHVQADIEILFAHSNLSFLPGLHILYGFTNSCAIKDIQHMASFHTLPGESHQFHRQLVICLDDSIIGKSDNA